MADALRFRFAVQADEFFGRAGGEWQIAGNHLVEGYPQAVQVAGNFGKRGSK